MNINNRTKEKKNLKQIAISEKNYNHLKSLGKAGDSFNDVLTTILQDIPKNFTVSESLIGADTN